MVDESDPLDYLASPGYMTSQRDKVERAVASRAEKEFRRFAAAARSGPAPTLGSLAAQWRATVEKVVSSTVLSSAPAQARQAMIERLAADPLPSEVFEHLSATQPTDDSLSAKAAKAAQRAARAETTAVFANSTLRELSREGFTAKRWVAHHDNHTRPTHLAADGQTVPLAAPFTVGGYPAQVPADASLPASEGANCRCIISGTDEGAASAAAAPDPQTPKMMKSRDYDTLKNSYWPEGYNPIGDSPGDLTPTQRSVWAYAGQDYKPVNSLLRGHETDRSRPRAAVARTIREIDEAFDVAPRLPAPTLTFRGGRLPADLKVGDLLNDSGYLSTSATPNVAREFAKAKSHRWYQTIELPSGQRVLPASPVEYELVLPRGTTLKVVSVDHSRRRIRMQVVPA